MAAVPLLSGILGSETGEFVRTVPLNLEPVIIQSGISNGQLKTFPGATQTGTGPGPDRGGVFWNGELYRVMGTKLCRIASNWAVTELGDVGAGGRCAFDYSFDRLAIWAGGKLFYYTPADELTQVTDEDLGAAIDGTWIDGYFMSTDGTYVVVTELSDPTQVQPLKFGSAEEDPDPIVGLLKYRGEEYIVGRYTTEVYENVGGNGFPFAVRDGAGFPYGAVSASAKALFGDGFAFVGSARGEGLNVYLASQGIAKPIGSRELCDELDALHDPAIIEVEARNSRNERRLFVHLPTKSWVFMLNASSLAQQPVWFTVASDSAGYRCRNAIEAYGQTVVGDTRSGAFGYLTENDRHHFGSEPQWQFDCGLLYNEALGAIVHSVELVGLPGRGGKGAVFMSMTRDGETFGAERSVRVDPARRTTRIAWRPHTRIGSYMGFRFRGGGQALPGIAACEVKAAPLAS